jgi:hypothetical protein
LYICVVKEAPARFRKELETDELQKFEKTLLNFWKVTKEPLISAVQDPAQHSPRIAGTFFTSRPECPVGSAAGIARLVWFTMAKGAIAKFLDCATV